MSYLVVSTLVQKALCVFLNYDRELYTRGPVNEFFNLEFFLRQWL